MPTPNRKNYPNNESYRRALEKGKYKSSSPSRSPNKAVRALYTHLRSLNQNDPRTVVRLGLALGVKPNAKNVVKARARNVLERRAAIAKKPVKNRTQENKNYWTRTKLMYPQFGGWNTGTRYRSAGHRLRVARGLVNILDPNNDPFLFAGRQRNVANLETRLARMYGKRWLQKTRRSK